MLSAPFNGLARPGLLYAITSCMGVSTSIWQSRKLLLVFFSMTIWQACYLRRQLRGDESYGHGKENTLKGALVKSNMSPQFQVSMGGMVDLMDKSQQLAKATFPDFIEDLRAQGWQTDRVLLTPNCAYLAAPRASSRAYQAPSHTQRDDLDTPLNPPNDVDEV